MKGSYVDRRTVLAGLLVSAATTRMIGSALAQEDPLPSWNEGRAKKAMQDFVSAISTVGSADFVPTSERIATFDNDGTFWCEQPMYVQLAFALDRVKALSAKHPEWRQRQPFKAVLDNDLPTLAKGGEKGLVELVMATHAGMTTAEFEQIASDWIKTARHPKFDRPYTDLVYQPMLELLAYLRTNSFKTFIVSGGGIEFMRPWSERIYGIPPEQVVGSSTRQGLSSTKASRHWSACRRSIWSTMAPASRSVSTRILVDGPSRRLAIPTVISRCCNGRRPRRSVSASV